MEEEKKPPVETAEAVNAETGEETNYNDLHGEVLGDRVKVLSPGRTVAKRFFRSKLSVIGLVIIVALFLISFFGPLFSPWGENEIDTTPNINVSYSQTRFVDASGNQSSCWDISVSESNINKEAEMSAQHWLGTDENGWDIFTRLMYGGRISLTIGFVVVILETLIGVVLGGLAGYFGGKVDMAMQRFLEIANGIPRLVIVTLLLLVLQPGMLTIIFALMLTEWVGMSRIARAEMLKLKEQEFVLASRTLGAGSFFIIFKEILPNIIGPIITQVMFSIPTAIFTEAFLSFVGLGIPVPQCSLGSLISEGFNSFTTHPYQIIPPIVVMALLMLSFNLVADGLREALDPKMKEM